MNRMIWPSASWISLRTAFRRSSNSPRYLEPAISAPMSSATTRRSLSCSGTSPETMRWARPSAIAVLPTPGSPIRTGLFLVRRARTWMTRRISSSRPMTGSSLPSSAACVRSRPNFSSDWYLSSGFSSVTRWGPRTASIAGTMSFLLAPLRRSASPAGDLWSARASSRCSVETYSSLNWRQLALGGAQDGDELAADGRLVGGALDGRELVERGVDVLADRLRAGAELAAGRGRRCRPPARAGRRAGARAWPRCGCARRRGRWRPRARRGTWS